MDVATTPPAQVRTEAAFFQEYYFRVSDDPERLAQLLAVGGGQAVAPTQTGGAGLDGMSGFRERLTRPTP